MINEHRIKLTIPRDWNSISRDIMALEKIIFSKMGLNESKEDLKIQFTNALNINHLALDQNQVIRAYSAAGPLENYIDVPSVKQDSEFNKGTTAYLYSLGVHPRFRREGIGNALIDSIISEMVARGLNRLVGHFLKDSSDLMKKRGAKIIGQYENWYGSGLPVDYLALRI